MDWLDEFKVAIVSKDSQKISALIETMPNFEKIEEMQEALFLVKEAYTWMSELRDEVLSQRRQIKKNIDFLESTVSRGSNGFDVSY